MLRPFLPLHGTLALHALALLGPIALLHPLPQDRTLALLVTIPLFHQLTRRRLPILILAALRIIAAMPHELLAPLLLIALTRKVTRFVALPLKRLALLVRLARLLARVALLSFLGMSLLGLPLAIITHAIRQRAAIEHGRLRPLFRLERGRAIFALRAVVTRPLGALAALVHVGTVPIAAGLSTQGQAG